GLPGGEVVVHLPVAGGGTTHAFEAVYATEAPLARLWCRLVSPMPVLPLPVDAFRRTWCFPAGITPLDDGRVQRLPGSGASAEASSIWTREASTLIPDSALFGLGAEEWRVRQQRLA